MYRHFHAKQLTKLLTVDSCNFISVCSSLLQYSTEVRLKKISKFVCKIQVGNLTHPQFNLLFEFLGSDCGVLFL